MQMKDQSRRAAVMCRMILHPIRRHELSVGLLRLGTSRRTEPEPQLMTEGSFDLLFAPPLSAWHLSFSSGLLHVPSRSLKNRRTRSDSKSIAV